MRYIALILIFIISVGVRATTYYVAKTGVDSNPGTIGSPFLTVQKGLNTAVAGDSILVGAGTYAENAITFRSGTNSLPITIDGQGVATLYSLIMGHGFVNVQNLTLMGKTNQWLMYWYGGADHCVVSNNTFDAQFNIMNIMQWNGPDAQPFGNAGSENLVISNVMQHCKGSVVVNSFGDSNVFRGNTMINCDMVDWFRVMGRSNLIVGNLCSNNFLLNGLNHPDFVQMFGGQGYGARGTIIESNLVIRMDEASQLCMFEGQDCDDLQDFTFRNNIFVGVAAKGTMACRNVKWYNNVFYKCSTNPLTAGSVLIFTWVTNATYTNRLFNSGHGGRVYNNAFVECGGPFNDRGWYSFDLSLTNIAADYNLVTKNGYQPVVTNTAHQSIGDPGGWLAQKWWENHGINGGNPQYIDPTNYNFHFLSTSLLRNAATNLMQFFDIDFYGTPRGASWDIGPIQYIETAVPCVPEP